MTTQTLATSQVAVLPRVNLLPPEIEERRRARKIQAGLGAAVALSVVGVAAGYLMAHNSANHAKDQLAAAQAQSTQLQTQVASYAGDESLRSQLSTEQGMLATAMGNEVQFSHFMNDLTLRIPDNVFVSQITFTAGAAPAAAPGAAAPAAGAASTGAIGSVSVTGVAYSHDDVATWLDSLAKEKGYANPYFQTSTEKFAWKHRIVSFTSTNELTSAALSGRYTQRTGS